MNYIFFCFVALLIATSNIFSQNTVTVFKSGTEGYKTFRIPAIIKIGNGNLLAFAEGRTDGIDDFGNIDIVMKKSSDNGISWGPLVKLVDYNNLQAGNAAPVLDIKDSNYPGGKIFLFYNTGNNSESKVRMGKGLREVWYIWSADQGQTWSIPVNITLQVHRPNQTKINPDYQFTQDWRSYANAPGHALQFQSGKYEGRIFVPANHSEGGVKPNFKDYFSHGFFTDDHGKTFHLGNKLNIMGSNEATAAELSDGKLMLNARNQRGDIRQRIVAISSNGGQSWDSAWFDKNLPDPVCQGSILNIGEENNQKILAFCNASDSVERDNLTLRISFDEGKKWLVNILVDKNPGKKMDGYTAYSDLVKIDENRVGILYERNSYSEIVFKIVNWK
ncbi:MAG: sialidase family protein [Bacteroidales bacterium]